MATAKPKAAVKALMGLDKQIETLVGELKAGKTFSRGGLRDRIRQLEFTKQTVMLDDFPEVFGLKFGYVFDLLYRLDDHLNKARGAADSHIAPLDENGEPGRTVLKELRAAQKTKEFLLRKLIAAGEAPSEVLAALRKIDSKIAAIIAAILRGGVAGFEAKDEINKIASDKLDMMQDHFPNSFRLPFWVLYEKLRDIDDDLRAAMLAASQGAFSEALTSLEAADNRKTDLELELIRANCLHPPYLSDSIRARDKRPCRPPPPTRQTLTVTKNGTGSGTISSSPAGIDCGSTCSAGFAAGTSVTLTAAPDANSDFAGFGGDCSGSSCTVKMATAHNVTAAFVLKRFQLQVTTQGQGGVQAGVQGQQPVINCPPNSTPQTQGCSASFDAGTTLILLAIPVGRQQFTGWLGDCTGTQNPCQLTMDTNKSVTAGFQ